MKYVSHPRQSDKLLKKFLKENKEVLKKEFNLYNLCHKINDISIEVQFFKKISPTSCAKILPANVENYNEVVNFNFSSVAENKHFLRTVLLVEVC